MKFSSVIFDWDNTVVDTHDSILEALNHTMDIMGKERLHTHDGHLPRIEKFMEMFGPDFRKANKIFIDNINKVPTDNLKVFDGAEQLFKKLNQQEVYTAICSNKEQNILLQEIQWLDFGKFFRKVIGVFNETIHSTGIHKPNKEMILRALGTRSTNGCVMIGDSATDLSCAENANVDFIQFGNRDRISQQHPHALNYQELEQILEI